MDMCVRQSLKWFRYGFVCVTCAKRVRYMNMGKTGIACMTCAKAERCASHAQQKRDVPCVCVIGASTDRRVMFFF